jgi:redox-sensitive bicupin YhaK (pirin superfamily)
VGENYFDLARPCVCGTNTLVLYGPADSIVVTTEKAPARFILVPGKPLKEPVAWYGPIVMNSQEELRTAFEEYQNGTFLRHARR